MVFEFRPHDRDQIIRELVVWLVDTVGLCRSLLPSPRFELERSENQFPRPSAIGSVFYGIAVHHFDWVVPYRHIVAALFCNRYVHVAIYLNALLRDTSTKAAGLLHKYHLISVYLPA